MIEVQNLSKTYNNNTQALKNLSLKIERGIIATVLGHNGAGKSTLLKLLTSIISPTAGDILIDGIPVLRADRNKIMQLKQSIGYLPEYPNLISKFTPKEYLHYVGQLYGIHDPELLSERIEELINLFNIDNCDSKMIEEYSSGLKKRIAIAAVLINEPKLLLLDEPTNNLDPVGIKIFKESIQQLRDAGCTILYATHNLEMAEKLSDKIVIIEQGKLIYSGTIVNLGKEYSFLNSSTGLENLYSLLTEKN